MADDYLTMDVSTYTLGQQDATRQAFSGHHLGGNDVFGLWVTILYNGKEVSQQVNLNRWTILGKLTDPNYRTPMQFNLDDDPAPDLETGFGFFRYGIEEITDQGTVEHKAWAVSSDFLQINDGLPDEYGQLEIWQEFHVNLHLLQSAARDLSHGKSPMANVFLLILQRLQTLLQHFKDKQSPHGNQDGQPLPATDDYIVLRVGYRSRAGEKIPLHVQKTFAVGRDDIFHPSIFQHEMDPNDIIGAASNDFLFGFQAFKAGETTPAYNIEFCVTFDPACYVVTQFTPLSGKSFFYYHTASDVQTNITFSSNLLTGGNTSEEENATCSFTLCLDSIPDSLIGPGKWMSFDLNRLGDHDALGGSFSYRASNKFDVGMILSSPWFNEKIQFSGIPKQADLRWNLNATFEFVLHQLIEVNTFGFIDLTMSGSLDEISVFYPKNATTTPDVTWLTIQNIPSSRRIEAGATLQIENSSMLTISTDGYISHDTTGSLGAITMYYPKPDPASDPDVVFLQIPAGSFAGSGRLSLAATLYVDPDPNNFWTNPANYLYATADQTANSNFGEADVYLPGDTVPFLKVSDIPSNAYGLGQFWWNQLQGQLIASRTSAGNPDPIELNVAFGDLHIGDRLRIGDGNIDVQGRATDQGYFSFNANNDMLDDRFEISNPTTGRSLTIEAGTIAASNFDASWTLNISTNQTQIDTLDFNGQLSTLRNFHVTIGYAGDQLKFNGNWSLGDQGSIDLDFIQDHPIVLDFNLDNATPNIDLHGSIILNSTLHYDMSWKWDQGSYTDPAYFKINENSNTPNIQAINLYFTYNDLWGTNVTLTGLALYVCVEWYWHDAHLYIWPVFSLTGDLTLDLLLNGVWYDHVEDNWP